MSSNSERPQQPRGPKKAKKFAMKKAEREQALALIEQLLIRRHGRRDIEQAVRMKFGQLSDQVISDMLKSVNRRWASESEEDRPHRVLAQREALLRLYREAEKAKDWRVCIEVEKLLAKMDGTTAPVKLAIATPQEWSDMEGRSVPDLNYYAEHGYWPEHAPAVKANGASPAGTNGSGVH